MEYLPRFIALETGRSLLELLCAIALTGVLSAGAIGLLNTQTKLLLNSQGQQTQESKLLALRVFLNSSIRDGLNWNGLEKVIVHEQIENSDIPSSKRHPPMTNSSAISFRTFNSEFFMLGKANNIFCLFKLNEHEPKPNNIKQWLALGADFEIHIAGTLKENSISNPECRDMRSYQFQTLKVIPSPFAQDPNHFNGPVHLLPISSSATVYLDHENSIRIYEHLSQRSQPLSYEVPQLKLNNINKSYFRSLEISFQDLNDKIIIPKINDMDRDELYLQLTKQLKNVE